MYSSFKKHQLITESWRRFLNEVSDEEKKYFGDWMDDEFLDQFQQDIAEKSKTKELDEYPTDKLNFVGRGNFRAVYRPEGDKDHVVKFALDKDGLEMNKTEFEFQTKSNLFPKVFGHSDNFSWIVMESLKTIEEPWDFNEFFPQIANMLEQLGFSDSRIHNFITETVFFPLNINDRSGALSPSESGWGVSYKDIVGIALDKSAHLKSPEFKDKILIPGLEELRKKFESEGNSEKLNNFFEMQDKLFNGEQDPSFKFNRKFLLLFSMLEEVLEQRLIEFCINIELVKKIRRVIKDFKLMPSEIRMYNTGVNSKGEFKILDASVEEQIR
jgi:hypothetical protein